MTKRKTVSSGAKWEDIVGYSRAVKVGNVIEVSGTTAIDENGNAVGIENPYEQAKYIFAKIETALKKLGASMDDVIRTRMFVTNINDWEKIGKAHGEVFREIKPAASMVEVKSLISPELLVEIEVSAVITD